MENREVISASQLSIGFRRKGRTDKVLYSGLSFSLNQGEVVALLGANGAGKSTLLRTLSSVQPVLEGSLQLFGKPLGAYRERERSRLIGLVLTERILAGGLTASELVSLGRQPHTGFLGRLNREDERVVAESLSAVGMESKAGSYVAELSDGERQKVMIAKVLAQECPVILLDEPTAFLDVSSRIETMNLLHRIAVDQRKTVLLSTHDLEQALLLSDRLFILSRHGFRCGVPEDLVFSGELEETFRREGISFDRLSGTFRPTADYDRKAFVQAPSDFLYWTKNLLERNGIGITDESQSAAIRIEVVSPVQIQVFVAGQQSAANLFSFAELARFLQKI